MTKEEILATKKKYFAETMMRNMEACFTKEDCLSSMQEYADQQTAAARESLRNSMSEVHDLTLEGVRKGQEISALQQRVAELETMWHEEHDERIRLEERLKMSEAERAEIVKDLNECLSKLQLIEEKIDNALNTETK